MSFPNPIRWLPVAAVPLVVGGMLAWLLLVFAGQRTGMVSLPEKNLRYLVDASGRLKPAEVERLPPERWQRWPERGYVIAAAKETFWVRITLSNEKAIPLRGVLENGDYFTDRVDAWVQAPNKPLHLISGEAVPAVEKTLVGREIAFPVAVDARSEQVVLLKMTDFRNIYARFFWWPEEADFHLFRAREAQAEGIYFGSLFALLGYNVLLWLRLRQADIGFYALYLAVAAVFMFLARAQVPAVGWVLGSPGLEKTLSAAMVLNGFALTRFASVFLDVKTFSPATVRGLRRWSAFMLVLAIVLLVIPTSLFQSWMRCAVIVTAVTHLGLVVLIAVAWRAGVWQARFFALSFGCLFAGSMAMTGVWFFESMLRDLAMRGLMIGSALEMLMLSLAVADRFARAQKELVEETEQRRMMEEAYSDELEEEVRERTRELRDANTDKDRILAVIGHDLRGPLTGLMRSASEAGEHFPRDVTRTGRALLLLIEDLVLWTRLRAGTRTTSVHPASSLVMPAVALHHSLAEHDGVQLVLDVPDDLRIETDLVLAQTLVRNLLSNGLKFARSRVVIKASLTGDGVCFVVGNDGPPLPPAVAARLAAGEDEPVTATGGMGLKLCREICLALDMPLKAIISPNGETEFMFIFKSLPMRDENP